MLRLLKIMMAILLSQPNMPRSVAKTYAKIVQRESLRGHIDPLDLVALVHSESRWRPNVTNYMGCQGLTQICPQFNGTTADLLNPEVNLRLAADNIAVNRAFCQKMVGRSARRNWLSSLGGYNVPSRNIYCGMQRVRGKWLEVKTPPAIQRILNHRRKLGY